MIIAFKNSLVSCPKGCHCNSKNRKNTSSIQRNPLQFEHVKKAQVPMSTIAKIAKVLDKIFALIHPRIFMLHLHPHLECQLYLIHCQLDLVHY